MRRLISIIQFMTRIPIKIDTGIDEEFHKGLLYFPIVGLVLGLLYYIVGMITSSVLPTNIAAVLVVVSEVVLTGGLHLDGVGDSFDGLYSYRDKDRILEIMKDSRLGTNGMVAIVVVIILKITLTSSLLDNNMLWIIVLMPVVARTMQVIACYKSKTPRENGMGNMFIGKITLSYLIITISNMIMIVTISVFVFHYMNIEGSKVNDLKHNMIVQMSSIVMLTVWVKLFIYSVYKKIDGITGDILGCISEIGEVIYLLLVIMLMNIN